MSTITLICGECGKQFDKARNEYNRRIRLGVTKFCCSRSCGMKASNKTSPRKGNPENLIAGNRRDSYSPFRWFLRNASRRKNKGNCDLDLSFLKTLWENQRGKCPLTGWKLTLPPNSSDWNDAVPFSSRSASLDRIDNSKGYVRGNVRFVAVIANYARNTFTDDDVIEFAKAVTKHTKVQAKAA